MSGQSLEGAVLSSVGVMPARVWYSISVADPLTPNDHGSGEEENHSKCLTRSGDRLYREREME